MDSLELRPEEQLVYEVIKELVERNGSKNRAALKLGCSRRSIDRYVAGYISEGKTFFAHGNRSRLPINAIPRDLAAKVVSLYHEKYYDSNFTHFTQLLRKLENIDISLSTVRRILSDARIASPQAYRRTKKRLNAQRKQVTHLNGGEQPRPEQVRSSIVPPSEAHPRRPRSTYFGEMIQMDASLHPWFGDHKSTLHIAVDDASGVVVGAWFDRQETLNGYYHVFYQILSSYGIPYGFYTDRRTVFEYRKSRSSDVADDSFTQFGYACMQLGVDIKTTSVPQAKGRIERLISTMQSRLPVELRLEDVTNIEQANACLPSIIVEYNAQYALVSHSIPSAFETQPSPEDIDRFLAVIAPRSVDAGHSIRFENQSFRTTNSDGMAISLRRGTKGLVIRTFSGALFFSAGDRLYALVPISSHVLVSKNLDLLSSPANPKKHYIPPLSHPWKQASFNAYLQRIAHSAASS